MVRVKPALLSSASQGLIATSLAQPRLAHSILLYTELATYVNYYREGQGDDPCHSPSESDQGVLLPPFSPEYDLLNFGSEVETGLDLDGTGSSSSTTTEMTVSVVT